MGFVLRLFFASLIVYLVYGLYVSNFNFTGAVEQTLALKHPMGLFDYKGVINVHTKASTGSGTIDEIVIAAQNAKLDFIVLTDLNAFPPNKSEEKYRDNLLLLNDGEYSYLDSRILFLDIKNNQEVQGPGQIQTLLGDHLSRVDHRESDSLFILSHPLKPGYGWSGPYPPGLNGVEVINLRSIWESGWKKNRASFVGSLLTYPFNSQLSFLRLLGELKDEQALWDQLTNLRPTFATVGTDAEAKIKITSDNFLKFPSYETLFSIASNHVLLKSELTGNFISDKEKIIKALADGQFYLSFDMLANPKGFSAGLKTSGDEYLLMGSKVKFTSDLTLQVQLPETLSTSGLRDHETVLIRNGKEIFRSKEDKVTYTVSEPGVYRFVINVIPHLPMPDGKKWIPWILSNPFYIH
jgi:hypothetical protein